MKKNWMLIVVLFVLALSTMACSLTNTIGEKFASDNGYVKPLGGENSVAVISGYGDSGSYGDAVNGRKIIVHDAEPLNPNGFAVREPVKVASLSELGISEKFEAPFVIEFERDFSQKANDFVQYYSMNINGQTDPGQVETFLKEHPGLVATSVVNRVDPQGKLQECSLAKIVTDEKVARFVLYSGQGIMFQHCDPAWKQAK